MPKKLLLLFLLIAKLSTAQVHYAFAPINSTNGLANNEVRNITQLPDGRMVITSGGIINIYNGTTFQYIHTNEQFFYQLKGYVGYLRSYVENSERLWMKNKGKLLLINNISGKFEKNTDSVLSVMGIHEKLADFFMDDAHDLWLLTASDKLLFREHNSGKVAAFCTNVSTIDGQYDPLYDIAVVNNVLYLFYRSGAFVCYDLHTHKQIQHGNSLSPQDQRKYNSTLFPVQKGNNIYQLRNGPGGGVMLKYDLDKKIWEKILEENYALNYLSISQKGDLLVSCKQGLWLFNGQTLQKQQISKLQLVNGTTINTEVSTLYFDNQDGLWIGTFNHGLLYYHPDRFKFRNLGRSFFPDNPNTDISISCFSELNNSNALVGTFNGLFKYTANAEKLTPYSRALSNINCNAMMKDRLQRTWLCTNKGLYCLTDKNTQFFPLGNINNIFCDNDNTLYLEMQDDGFGIFNPITGKYQRLDINQKIEKVDQLVRFKGMLIGICNSGLFTYDPKTKTLNIQKNTGNNVSAMFNHGNHNYKALYVDSRGLLWFGTQDGLYLWDDKQQKTLVFHDLDGLVSNSIKAIVEDHQHTLWVSTSGGVSRIFIESKNGKQSYSFSNFNTYDGVIGEEFLRRSIYISKNNRLFIGGINGFNEIDLGRFSFTQRKLHPLFTSFKVFGEEIKENTSYNGNRILIHNITSTGKIKLNHNQNFFTIGFTGLNYVNPTQTYYRYILEGVDDVWHEISTTDGVGRVTYTDLSPGNYTFKVRAADNGGDWTGPLATMTIIIKTPFWRTPLAILFYIILIVLGVYGTLRFYLKQSKLAIIRRQKQKLDLMKINFLTNMGHELRTPLTLILTPLDAIVKKINDAQLKSQLEGIHNNAFNMLNMVNNLLDFSPTEFEGEKLKLDFVNIIDVLEPIAASFSELTKEKDINFCPDFAQHDIFLYLDRDKVTKMINNLLSNAYKFTQAGGTIKLDILKRDAQETLEIRVTDTGKGIEEKDINRIFDRFYQATNQTEGVKGNGIGLNLVKEYLDLHGGNIEVKSQVNSGSEFTIHLPLNLRPADAGDAIIDEYIADGNKPQILIVEDNDAFRGFLMEQLAANYNVVAAPNGKVGFAKLIETMPDLVISDITMPEMDGIELCKKIKTDIKVSHTPVILLTARYSENVQLNAYKAGADAYISKPFNLDILLLRVHNLIEQQKQRKKLFKNSIIIQPEEITTTSIDQKLIEKALKCVEKNLDNSSYSVEQLSKDMNMDRTGLYRKLVAIMGQNPTAFIRTVRLKNAVHLLKQKRLSQAEITEKVGFSNAAYFSKCFKEEYGVSPSHYHED